jgi:hypothetical protein
MIATSQSIPTGSRRPLSNVSLHSKRACAARMRRIRADLRNPASPQLSWIKGTLAIANGLPALTGGYTDSSAKATSCGPARCTDVDQGYSPTDSSHVWEVAPQPLILSGLSTTTATLITALGVLLAPAGAAHASGGALSGDSVELFRSFLV